jgi:DNA-binding MarR family transcriptional regulator
MSSAPNDEPKAGDDPDGPRAVWLAMADLVLDNVRRRAVADALGMPFGRTRAIRRLARKAMSMREFAAALDIDPPNATAVADQLEAAGLVTRRPNPDDRRAKLVELTPKGRALAERANDILAAPPAGLAALPASDLATLRRILRDAAAAGPGDPDPPA